MNAKLNGNSFTNIGCMLGNVGGTGPPKPPAKISRILTAPSEQPGQRHGWWKTSDFGDPQRESHSEISGQNLPQWHRDITLADISEVIPSGDSWLSEFSGCHVDAPSCQHPWLVLATKQWLTALPRFQVTMKCVPWKMHRSSSIILVGQCFLLGQSPIWSS